MVQVSFGSNYFVNGGGGYAPQSARDRQIEDGSIYDSYFRAPLMKVECEKKDGDVDDTVQIMIELIKKHYKQVECLAKDVLAVYSADGYIDIRTTSQNIFDFVFKYIKYNLERGEQLQTPSHCWYQAQVRHRETHDMADSADCDCMAIFCSSCMYALGIPHSLRIAGYSANNYQHVYVIAYDYDGSQIIVDPVMPNFNEEKPPVIKKTISVLKQEYKMVAGLQGTDIYVLSGIENVGSTTTVYSEQNDGSLVQLSGPLGKSKAKKQAKKAKKAKKQNKKAAKILAKAKKAKGNKAKRLNEKATKKSFKAQVSQAKASGDKDAVNTAKAHLKNVKKQIKQAKKEDGRGFFRKVAKVTVKTSLIIPRSMFLLLLRMNFRGLARRLSNNQTAFEKFAKVWKKLGGSSSKLKKNIEKGKSKKALFGSKKTKGDPVGQLYELGQVLYAQGVFNRSQLGALGDGGATGFAAAIASAAPIITKVVNVMKQVGEFIPETAEEADAAGEDVYEAPDDLNINYNPEDIEDNESENIPQQEFQDDSQYPSYEEGYEDFDVSESEIEEVENLDPNTEIDEEEFDYDEYVDAIDDESIDDSISETMEGFYLHGYEDGYVYVDDIAGINGELSGKGLFKKVFKKVGGGIKKVAGKIKEKRAEKKAKKQAKKDNKANNQQTTSQTTSETKTKGAKFKQLVNKGANLINQKQTQTAKPKSTGLMPNTQSLPPENPSFVKQHPVLVAVGGTAVVGLLVWGGIKLFSKKSNNNLNGTYFKKVKIK